MAVDSIRAPVVLGEAVPDVEGELPFNGESSGSSGGVWSGVEVKVISVSKSESEAGKSWVGTNSFRWST